MSMLCCIDGDKLYFEPKKFRIANYINGAAFASIVVYIQMQDNSFSPQGLIISFIFGALAIAVVFTSSDKFFIDMNARQIVKTTTSYSRRVTRRTIPFSKVDYVLMDYEVKDVEDELVNLKRKKWVIDVRFILRDEKPIGFSYYNDLDLGPNLSGLMNPLKTDKDFQNVENILKTAFRVEHRESRP